MSFQKEEQRTGVYTTHHDIPLARTGRAPRLAKFGRATTICICVTLRERGTTDEDVSELHELDVDEVHECG